MNLEIVANHPFRTPGLFCEGRHGGVGHCEVPPSRMRALPGAQSMANEASACLWWIDKGHLSLELPSGSPARFGPGTVLLWDPAQHAQAQWEHACFSYVRLSPLRFPTNAAPSEQRPPQRVDHLGLAAFLTAQLHAFAAHAGTLNITDRVEVVGGIVQVAETLLKGALGPATLESPRPDAGRLQDVHRYIDRNLHRSDLSVADIARETSMSRAQLYRVFAAQADSVHGTLREKRLQKSLGYLQQPDSQRLSIGAIAHACGFSDPSVFSKLFRQRFNQAPREVRAAVSAGPSTRVSTVIDDI